MLQKIGTPLDKEPPVVRCSGVHKTRLLIGEGNFSFALALINKHDKKAGHSSVESLAHFIVATELKSKVQCEECDLGHRLDKMTISPQNATPVEKCEKCKLTSSRILMLIEKGAVVILGVDGTQIEKVRQLHGRKFQRIHWNIPQDGKNVQNRTLPPIIKNFFASCSTAQNVSDRIHISVPCPGPEDYKKTFYQAYVYDLVMAASAADYYLVKKRKFEPSRYSEYSHVRTNLNEPADIVQKGAREFVFQKADPELVNRIYQEHGNGTQIDIYTLASKLMVPSQKKYDVESRIIYGIQTSYYECSSDEDSSDYELQ